MAWMPLDFGKHKGRTLPQIVFTDPDWLFWAMENNVFAKRPLLKSEADTIWKRAQRIKIPPKKPLGSKVEYVIHPGVGKLAWVDVVSPDHPHHDGASLTIREDYFDMSFPRNIANYDKLGGKIIIKAIKYLVRKQRRAADKGTM
jgi:hypothetical protein